jgi:hypothetical protein
VWEDSGWHMNVGGRNDAAGERREHCRARMLRRDREEFSEAKNPYVRSNLFRSCCGAADEREKTRRLAVKNSIVDCGEIGRG